MDIHLTFTGHRAKEREIEKLRSELAVADETVSDLRAAREISDRKAEEFRTANQANRKAYEAAAKRVDELSQKITVIEANRQDLVLEKAASRSVLQLLRN